MLQSKSLSSSDHAALTHNFVYIIRLFVGSSTFDIGHHFYRGFFRCPDWPIESLLLNSCGIQMEGLGWSLWGRWPNSIRLSGVSFRQRARTLESKLVGETWALILSYIGGAHGRIFCDAPVPKMGLPLWVTPVLKMGLPLDGWHPYLKWDCL